MDNAKMLILNNKQDNTFKAVLNLKLDSPSSIKFFNLSNPSKRFALGVKQNKNVVKVPLNISENNCQFVLPKSLNINEKMFCAVVDVTNAFCPEIVLSGSLNTDAENTKIESAFITTKPEDSSVLYEEDTIEKIEELIDKNLQEDATSNYYDACSNCKYRQAFYDGAKCCSNSASKQNSAQNRPNNAQNSSFGNSSNFQNLSNDDQNTEENKGMEHQNFNNFSSESSLQFLQENNHNFTNNAYESNNNFNENSNDKLAQNNALNNSNNFNYQTVNSNNNYSNSNSNFSQNFNLGCNSKGENFSSNIYDANQQSNKQNNNFNNQNSNLNINQNQSFNNLKMPNSQKFNFQNQNINSSNVANQSNNNYINNNYVKEVNSFKQNQNENNNFNNAYSNSYPTEKIDEDVYDRENQLKQNGNYQRENINYNNENYQSYNAGNSLKYLEQENNNNQNFVNNNINYLTNNSKEEQGAEDNINQDFSQEPQTFYQQIKSQLDNLFSKYQPEENLEQLIANSKWVKVNYDNSTSYYVLGLIYSDDFETVEYISYGMPSNDNLTPPEDIKDYAQWLPLENKDNNTLGYWIVYQDAITGDTIKVNFV